MAPSSDRRAQRNRSRDPSWIPRPRNAFIIFRCEYSRKHSQAAQESDEESEAPNPTAKTLSKRAAEAWKQLSASDKDKYKVLADKEREEHARLYPHYRFRPMRRQISGLKKRQYDLGLSNNIFPLDSSDEQVPAYIADADEDSQEDGGVTHQQAIEKEGSENLEASGDSAPKDVPKNCSAAQRRSSSVPLPDAFPTLILPSHAPKDDLCRSRSTEGREWLLRPLDYVSQAAH
ncbi:high mobility group box domain-containing protein, partial [Suillus subalutaceus]|uniref:high mobility group box domain-containing protein n=1 Tax=Suillus subalutaceus TaxID=48586 RepID=UPI001B877F51